MRLRLLLTAFLLSVAAVSSNAIFCAEAYLTPGKVYNYKVSIKIKSETRTAGSETPETMDSLLEIAMRHKVDKGINKDETQSLMSVQTASFTVNDQKIQLSPTTFPQVTIIADKNGVVKNVFGASGPGMPGLNFTNFILFLLPDTQAGDVTQMKVGSKWERQVILSDTRQAVKVTSEYKGIQKENDNSRILVHQNFELVPPKDGTAKDGVLKSFSGKAVTEYAVSNCRPLKSHAEIEVVGAQGGQKAADVSDENKQSVEQDKGDFRAKLHIDLLAQD